MTARAIRCAGAISEATQNLGSTFVSVSTPASGRSGATTWRGSPFTSGRVAAIAGAGEVLVSSTVKDLVAGSGITFADRGEPDLKGVPDTWRLYAVQD